MVRAGVTNTVATCGTALGEGHFRLASRFAQRMVLAFDSDDAGARAAERAFEFVERFPVQPVVLILPEGLDPADFVDQHGGERAPRARGRRRPARRVHGATDRGPPRPLDDRGAERGGRRGRPAARAARRPGPPERVRAPAGRARRGLGGFGRARARAAALGTPGRGPAGRQARLGAGEGRARDAPDPRSGRRRVPVDRAAAVRRALPDDAAIASCWRCSCATRRPRERRRPPRVETRRSCRRSRRWRSNRSTAIRCPAYAEEVWARLQEFLLRRRSAALRQELQKMNPVTDPRYDELFQRLIAADGELRRLRERGHDAA